MLDELDRAIIRELERDGRTAFREIGRTLNISEATVRARYRRLVEADLLRIVAFPDPGAHSKSRLALVFLKVAPGQHETVVKTLAQYAPDLPALILNHQIITPHELEDVYGLTGGHIFHGELALDQFFTMRPLLDWARYRTPIKKLYLCGSGTHPGAGLTGGSGANAAGEIVKELRR